MTDVQATLDESTGKSNGTCQNMEVASMDSTDTSARISNATPGGLSRDVLATMRGRLAMVHARLGTRGLILLAALAVAAIGYSSWGWLVAIGLAPIILGVLPCAAM